MSCFVCKQKKAYEMRISEWSSDVCSSDLSRVDTALQVHGVDAGGNVFQAFFNDGLSQNGSGGGTVASVVGGLGSDFLDQLGADVFEFVFQFDFFSNRHAVRSEERTSELQSLMRISYAVFCLKKQTINK